MLAHLQVKWQVLISAGLLLLNACFIAGGAQVFSSLEKEAFSNTQNSLVQRRVFLEYFIRDGVDQWRLKELHQQRCFKGVIYNLEDQPTGALWNYGRWFDFTATTLTTIGYGSTHPRTLAGRWFCVSYILIGIPLVVFFLLLSGDAVCAIVGEVLSAIEKKREHLGSRALSFVILLSALGIFTGLCNALIKDYTTFKPLVQLKDLSGYSTLESLYLIVTTLTTIGLDNFLVEGTNGATASGFLCVGVVLVVAALMALFSFCKAAVNRAAANTADNRDPDQDGANEIKN